MENEKVYITSIHRNRLNDHEIEVRGYSARRFEYFGDNIKSMAYTDEQHGISFALKYHRGHAKLQLTDGVLVDLFDRSSGINRNSEIESVFEESRLLIKEIGFFSQFKTILKKMKQEKRYKESVFQVSALLYRKFHKNKTLALFADRIDKANDNAEFLYQEVNHQKIKKFFVLRKDSPDYKRLQKIAHVIPFGSFKHKVLSLVADYIVSSHADNFLLNPFLKNQDIFKGFFNYRFVFLQHGVTKDDMSAWLKREGKDIYYLITSSEKEAESFLTGNYQYNKNEIKITGMPRFDKLSRQNMQKRIVFMPTWRAELAGVIDQQTGKFAYNPEFKESSFFKTINNFLSDPKLEELLERTGYEFIFIPHPNLVQQKDDFFTSTNIKIRTENVDYSHFIQTSEVLITDYSSVAFDFAYNYKQVIYFQFDQGNLVPGYFDYSSMGFGPVIEEASELVEVLSEILLAETENNRTKYDERVNEFFLYKDQKNSARVSRLIR